MTKQKIAVLGLSLTLGAGALVPAAQALTQSQVNNFYSKVRDVVMEQTLDTACMSTAVDTRDTAVISAEASLHTAWSAALATRKDSLKTAWALSDTTARRQAIRAAWKAYRTSRSAAWKAWTTGRNGAWKTWSTDRKACGASSTDDKTDKSIDMVTEPTNR